MTPRGPTTQSLDDRIDALSGDMQGLTRTVHDFASDLRWIKRIEAFVAVSLVAALAGSGRVIWEASAVNTKVDQQGKVLEELRADVKQHGKVLEDLRADAKQQGGRLEAVERRLDKIDGQVDAIGKQLDTLLSRTAPKPGG
jgi:septal ring factor EnvC (AmiA/AmiB activator)